MPLMRRPPWLAGLLLLALAVAFAAPLVAVVGTARWPYLVGLVALLLVLFGAVERFWQQHSLPGPQRLAKRRRFRILRGGKKGNGHTQDEGDGSSDKPRWVM